MSNLQRISLFALALFCMPLRAALTTGVVWEVRQAGSSSNGGCFDSTVGVPGTDRSQQNAAQITYTDLVAPTTTTVTSAAFPFTAAEVGNCLNITSGTGWTTGRYMITSFSGITATVDRAIATAASTGGNGKLGGALDTLVNLNAAMNTCQHAWVKADATYTMAAGVTFNVSCGALVTQTQVSCYTTTRGDNGRCTFQATAAITLITLADGSAGMVLRNMNLDCNSQTSSIGLQHGNNYGRAEHITASNCKNIPIYLVVAGAICVDCRGTANVSPSLYGILVNLGTCIFCIADGNQSTGIQLESAGKCFWCLSVKNTGASSDCFFLNALGTGAEVLMGSTGYQCGRDGVRYKFTSNNQYPTILMNNLLTGSTGWGIRTIDGAGSTQTVKLDDQVEDYNAYYNNTAGGIAGFTAGAHDVVPTGDPFTNAAGNIYTLNNTAGAGAVVRAAGFPGVLTFGGTGYLDIGALQHADPAAVSGGSFGFVQ